MPITRREICRLLPALLPIAVELPAFAAQGEPLPSATFEFVKLPVEERGHAEIRSIMKGKLVTGESVEVHESTLPPNGFPHAPHHHAHSEMWLIREGTLQLTINGTPHVLGPGGLGFVRSNEEHGIRNVGTTTANYYVVAIGPGADTQA
jgi:mannose-6-phosphate isomerase-like protein (cupin superfamily)